MKNHNDNGFDFILPVIYTALIFGLLGLFVYIETLIFFGIQFLFYPFFVFSIAIFLFLKSAIEKNKKLLHHGIYVIATTSLMSRLYYVLPKALSFTDTMKVGLYGFVTIVAFLLGIFKTQDSLRYALILSSLISGYLTWYYFNFKITLQIQFMLALMALMVLFYVLYCFYKKQSGIKEK